MSMEEIKIQSLIETLHLCVPECPQGRWSRDSAVESPEGRVLLWKRGVLYSCDGPGNGRLEGLST